MTIEIKKFETRPKYVSATKWEGGQEQADLIIAWLHEYGTVAEYRPVLNDAVEAILVFGQDAVYGAMPGNWIYMDENEDFYVLPGFDFAATFSEVQKLFGEGEGLFQ